MVTDEDCIKSYESHKHLKKSADELGIKWQTLYVRLKRNGIQVTGDKSRYGSLSDKIGAKGEADFKRLVPSAVDQNETQFQAPIDFLVLGHGVDVKSANRRKAGGKSKGMRWAFSIKKQESTCDFFVLLAYTEDQSRMEKAFLIPAEVCRYLQSISISTTGGSKWFDYEVDPNDLDGFFGDIGFKSK